MKNTGFLFLAFATLAFSACMNNKSGTTKADVTKDTLMYTYQEVKERASDCGKEADDDGCSYADIKYPDFKSQPVLNDTIKKHILSLFDGADDKDLPSLVKNFVAEYDEYKHLMKKKPKIPFALDISVKVMRQDSNFVTTQVDGSSYDGQQRVTELVKFINWNTKTNKSISLDDIFNPGYKEKLNTIAEKIFRKEENLKDTSSLARDYFFKNAKFTLNDNFLLTPTGIRFLYNTKEIKPAAAGTTDLFIPYSQITTLLKPNTVLAQYIKH